ncbi:MAG: hypothetical protein IT384_31630 [Deltaproteobacteria bacterium]|nr:hypothetical protein [Deltaproteobacteria bacterium]
MQLKGLAEPLPAATPEAQALQRPAGEVRERSDPFADAISPALVGRGAVSWDPSSEVWQRILAQTANPDRARVALELFGRSLEGLEGRWAMEAAVLVWAAGTGRDGPGTEGLVTPIQGAKALRRIQHMEPALRSFVDGLLNATASSAERAVLLKGIAARVTREDDPSLRGELTELAGLVHGQSLDWMIAHTTAYGLETQDGLQQAHVKSCAPTIAQLAKAENDPLAALAIALDPFDPLDERSLAAREQKRMLEAAGGEAVSLRLYALLEGKIPGGRGSDLRAFLEEALRDAGIGWNCYDWAGLTAKEKKSLLDIAEKRLLLGYDLPLFLTEPGTSEGHYRLLTDVTYEQGRRAWRVHDTILGKSRYLSDDAFLKGPFAAPDVVLSSLYLLG